MSNCEHECTTEETECTELPEECPIPEDVEGDPQYLLGECLTPKCYYLGSHRVEGRELQLEDGSVPILDGDSVLDVLSCKTYISCIRAEVYRMACPGEEVPEETPDIDICVDHHLVRKDGVVVTSSPEILSIPSASGPEAGDLLASDCPRLYLPAGGVLVAKLDEALTSQIIKITLFCVPERAIRGNCCTDVIVQG